MNLSLAIFFTRGVSLRTWDTVGMFSREVALYKRLQEQGVSVTFVTYGDKREYEFQKKIPGIRICCNRWRMPEQWYARFLPWLHAGVLRKADILKTNQMRGGCIALCSARRWRKPLVARCGYLWSKNASLEHGACSVLARQSLAEEEKVFNGAASIIVTSLEMRDSIIQRFPNLAERVNVIPNYVDTEVFVPLRSSAPENARLCFVGRLAPEKNLGVLIDAVREIDVKLDIVGQGPLLETLQQAAAGNPKVRFLGRVPNEQLPEFLRQSTAFVFPSLYEGHPKTPVEAMACGVPVIGTDVSGIKEIVRHGETGWLCQPDVKSLKNGIEKILSDPLLRERLGNNARQYVLQNFALDNVAARELKIYQDLLQPSEESR